MKGQHQKTVRALLGSVREYKKPSLLCPVFVVLEVLMEVLVPGVMALMIDKGMSGGSIGYILKIGAVLLVMSMMALVFGILAGTNAARASAGMARNLRKDMFHHIQEFSFSNIDRFSPSSLVTRLTTDITNVQNAYQMVIRIAIRGHHALFCADYGYGNQQGAFHHLFYRAANPGSGALLHCDKGPSLF